MKLFDLILKNTESLRYYPSFNEKSPTSSTFLPFIQPISDIFNRTSPLQLLQLSITIKEFLCATKILTRMPLRVILQVT